MIPLRDNIPSERTPIVNFAMIGVTALCFLLQLASPNDSEVTVEEKFGMVPVRVLHPHEKHAVSELVRVGGQLYRREHPLASSAIPDWLTPLTCIFLHGGWLHFVGNMWFLFIFGDNVEDRLGHIRYLVFYLASGVGASLVHLVTNASSPIPTIGASGAIAGVMGAYFVLYPRATVLSMIPIFGFAQIVVIPAPMFLGIWFVIQFFQGTMAITSMQTGGVAWWAHIGGFAVGFVVGAIARKFGRHDIPDRERYREPYHLGIQRYR